MPICDYSLRWLISVEQYHAVTADDALIREVLPAMRDCVMGHVESGFTSEGLFIQPVGSKLFFDWVSRPWDKRPYSLVLNLTVLRALRSAAVVADAAGDSTLADHCRRRDAELARTIAKRFWSDQHHGWLDHIEPSAQVQREVLAGRPADWLEDPWQKIIVDGIERRKGNLNPTPCTRHGNALALWMRLGSADQQAAAARLLVAAFEPHDENNNGMSPLWTDKIFGISLKPAGMRTPFGFCKQATERGQRTAHCTGARASVRATRLNYAAQASIGCCPATCSASAPAAQAFATRSSTCAGQSHLGQRQRPHASRPYQSGMAAN